MSTQRLAEWISSHEHTSIPEEVITAAIRSFYNALGCTIGGSSHGTVTRTIKALSDADVLGNGECIVVGQGETWNSSTSKSLQKGLSVDLQNAALINGIASHVHDYDDTHLHTVIHPAGAVVVALLAYTQHLKGKQGRIVTGIEFITALVVGIEIGLRVGNAISPDHYSEGWHITGTVSPIAVAAGISSLLHLQPDRTIHALGLATAQPVGIRVHFGTDTKPFHVGRAAQNGITAAILAKGGFTAARDALEGRRGWVEVLGNGSNTLEEQVDQLIELSKQAQAPQSVEKRVPWETEKNTFKPFPCGIVIHPTIDACIQLHNEHNLKEKDELEKIKRVYLKVHPLVLDLTGKKTPQDGLEAKFSVYHGAAVGLVLGSATPSEYADEVVKSPQVLRVRDNVVAEVDENMRSDEALVILTMADGSTIEKYVEHAVGSLGRPMTSEELKDKFLKQVEPVLGKEAAEYIERLAWKVAELDDVCLIAEAAR